jgi:hypothetical protein
MNALHSRDRSGRLRAFVRRADSRELREEKVLATGALGDLSSSRLHHLAQRLDRKMLRIFLLGLSALTFTMLRSESWMRKIGYQRSPAATV